MSTAILEIKYSDLSDGRGNARQVGNMLNGYIDDINTGVSKKLASINNNDIFDFSNAVKKIDEKKKELQNKSDEFFSFADKISDFHTQVAETDRRVAQKIESLSGTFIEKNNINISPVAKFLASLSVNGANATGLGQWLKNTYIEAKEIVSKLWENGFGKYVKELVFNFGLTCVAIIGGVAGGAALIGGGLTALGVVAAIGAVGVGAFTTVDFIINFNNTIKAGKEFDNRDKMNEYGEINTLGDHYIYNGDNEKAVVYNIGCSLFSLMSISEGIKKGWTSIANIADEGWQFAQKIYNGFSLSMNGIKNGFINIGVCVKEKIRSIGTGGVTEFLKEVGNQAFKIEDYRGLSKAKDNLSTLGIFQLLGPNRNKIVNIFTGIGRVTIAVEGVKKVKDFSEDFTGTVVENTKIGSAVEGILSSTGIKDYFKEIFKI